MTHKEEDEDDNWWCDNDNCGVLISHPPHYNFCHHCGAEKPSSSTLLLSY